MSIRLHLSAILLMLGSVAFALPTRAQTNLGGKKITATLQPHSWNTFTLPSGTITHDIALAAHHWHPASAPRRYPHDSAGIRRRGTH